MPDQSVSRRLALGTIAGGVVGATLVSASLAGGDDLAPEPVTETDAQLPREASLLAPLAAGSRILSWSVVAIEPLTMGAVRVQLEGESGVAFAVEVLARDGSPLAARPPARTENFALYVSNGGDGRMPTAEEQGLAAMALAQIVARNEAHVSSEGFLTQGERLDAHPVALLRHVDGSTLSGPFDPATARA
jgi:hypothetical protein